MLKFSSIRIRQRIDLRLRAFRIACQLGGPADVGDRGGHLQDAVSEAADGAALLLAPGPYHQAAAYPAAALFLVGLALQALVLALQAVDPQLLFLVSW